MTTNSNTITEIAATDVTAELLRTTDTNQLVVRTASGRMLGTGHGPSITWGVHNTFDGDYDGFAAWMNTQV
jgi:hypothetical protein